MILFRSAFVCNRSVQQARRHAGRHGHNFWIWSIRLARELRSLQAILWSSPEDSASRERSHKIFGLCHFEAILFFIFCLCPLRLLAFLVCPPPPAHAHAHGSYSYVLFCIHVCVTRLACGTLRFNVFDLFIFA